MPDAPATPPLNISDSDSDATRTPMDTDEEEDLLDYGIGRDNNDDSDEDGFQHV